jgi:hypothetical protein
LQLNPYPLARVMFPLLAKAKHLSGMAVGTAISHLCPEFRSQISGFLVIDPRPVQSARADTNRVLKAASELIGSAQLDYRDAVENIRRILITPGHRDVTVSVPFRAYVTGLGELEHTNHEFLAARLVYVGSVIRLARQEGSWFPPLALRQRAAHTAISFAEQYTAAPIAREFSHENILVL